MAVCSASRRDRARFIAVPGAGDLLLHEVRELLDQRVERRAHIGEIPIEGTMREAGIPGHVGDL